MLATDGESETVAQAIEAHYRPRYAGDELPNSLEGCAVALADKLDTLAGIFWYWTNAIRRSRPVWVASCRHRYAPNSR